MSNGGEANKYCSLLCYFIKKKQHPFNFCAFRERLRLLNAVCRILKETCQFFMAVSGEFVMQHKMVSSAYK